MYEGKTICVVVPAYNEELLIGQTITSMPKFVDTIVVINDCSTDRTLEKIKKLQAKDKRVVLINHDQNQGVGQSLIDGYLKSLEMECDITAVMAGDAQMDPDDLPAILEPIASGKADYTKGNRLLMEDVVEKMPRYRYFGNSLLTLLTKFATGYWHIIDPQCGYTAISKKALSTIHIENMFKGYGYPADILNMLNLYNFRVVDVPIKPIYGEETSTIILRKFILDVSKLLLRLFLRRMRHKYLVREFHPLIFFYFFSILNLIFISVPLTFRLFYIYFTSDAAPQTTLIILTYSLSMGIFSLFFGMWLDMEDNKKFK
jgi:glycosyltransferase involved in cell wall biosynthesis